VVVYQQQQAQNAASENYAATSCMYDAADRQRSGPNLPFSVQQLAAAARAVRVGMSRSVKAFKQSSQIYVDPT
jgi:hypothetical protein